MPPARNSIQVFLKQSQSALKKGFGPKDHVTFVAGNESADLDSLTAALLYGYFSTYSHIANTKDATTSIPIINIPAPDLKLRPEFKTLLSHASVLTDDLVTLGEITSADLPHDTDLVLVDHNAPTGLLKQRYEKHLVGCIDHHEDEGAVPQSGIPRVIKRSGSCTSLVVQHFQSTWDNLSSLAISSGATDGQGDGHVGDADSLLRHWDSQVAKLGMGSILVDTHNLLDESKVTDDDRQAVEYLETKILSAPDAATWNRTTFLEQLEEAKQDLDSLTVTDCLRKDYKMWTEGGAYLGFSSVVKPITWLITKAGSPELLLSEIESYKQSQHLSIFVLMTTFTGDDGKFSRELLLSASGGIDVVQKAAAFAQRAKDELGLINWDGDAQLLYEANNNFYRQVWRQTKTQHSRKRVAPLLREVMRNRLS